MIKSKIDLIKIQFGSTQGIFYIVDITNKRYDYHHSTRYIDDTPIKVDSRLEFLFHLKKDSYEWRKIIHTKKPDGIIMHAVYNDDLFIIDWTLYPPASIFSLQTALGFDECLVFKDTSVDFNFGNVSQHQSWLINAANVILHATSLVKISKGRHTTNTRALNAISAEALPKLTNVIEEDEHFTGHHLIFTPTSLTQLLNFFNNCTITEKDVILKYINDVTFSEKQTL